MPIKIKAADYMSIDSENILICGLNWLGDGVMSMPALHLFKERFPSAHLTMLVQAGLTDLWKMCSSVDVVVPREVGVGGMMASIGDVKAMHFDRSFVFPNSPRAALIPYLAGVAERRGVRGSHRSWLLTDIVEPVVALRHRHQAWEYVDILGLSAEDCVGWNEVPGAPLLDVPSEAVATVEIMLGSDDYVAMLPGAARGPAKQWPQEYFIDLGRRLRKSTDCRVALFGAASEGALCSKIADEIGKGADSFAGKTSLTELAVALRKCRVVVTNDSGGMHLAAATGSKVVGIFGLTDHTSTGPLGDGHRIVVAEIGQKARDIPRNSEAARVAMSSIRPETVHSIVLEVLAESRGG